MRAFTLFSIGIQMVDDEAFSYFWGTVSERNLTEDAVRESFAYVRYLVINRKPFAEGVLNDLENETSFVKKMTCAMLAVVSPAAHSAILS